MLPLKPLPSLLFNLYLPSNSLLYFQFQICSKPALCCLWILPEEIKLKE